MADHVLTLPLTDEALERLKAAARAAGMKPEAYAVAILDKALATWAEDDASSGPEVRESDAAFIMDDALTPWPPTTPYDTTEAKRRLAKYDRTGKFIEFEDWAAGFEAEIEAMLKARA